jgi:hypothetical protein
MVEGAIGTVPSQQAFLAFDAGAVAGADAVAEAVAARGRRHVGSSCDCLRVSQQDPMTVIWWLLDGFLVSSLNIDDCLERDHLLLALLLVSC